MFLQPVLKNGLTGDDWNLLFNYKTFDPKPLNRISDAWVIMGPYTTIQFYYIGILENLFGLNYQLYQIINIGFKIFASVTLYLLISKIFKDYLLASISAVVFSMIHSSAGALQYVVKGSEYLAICFMNLFFLYYYDSITKNSLRLTFFSSVILFTAFMLSPIRLYPLFVLIILIELYLLIKKIALLSKSLLRLTIFYLPVFFLALISRNIASGYLGETISFLKDITNYNWYYLLLPFKALGYTLFGNDQLGFLHIPPYMVGLLIFLISAVFFIIWIKNGLNKNFLLFFGPFFAFLFLIATWMILGRSFNVIASLHWYLIIPSLGISVFIASIITLLLKIGVHTKKLGYLIVAFLIFIATALISYYEIDKHYNYLLSIGTRSEDQIYMQNQILNSINNQNQLNLIVFFDLSKDTKNNQFYEVSLNTGHFAHWIDYFKSPKFLGCITVITSKEKLIEFYRGGDNEYFESEGLCAQTQYNVGTIKIDYDIKDFRAFLLNNKKVFNITDQVLKDLRLKKL